MSVFGFWILEDYNYQQEVREHICIRQYILLGITYTYQPPYCQDDVSYAFIIMPINTNVILLAAELWRYSGMSGFFNLDVFPAESHLKPAAQYRTTLNVTELTLYGHACNG